MEDWIDGENVCEERIARSDAASVARSVRGLQKRGMVETTMRGYRGGGLR
jgi:hypothetical protein